LMLAWALNSCLSCNPVQQIRNYCNCSE